MFAANKPAQSRFIRVVARRNDSFGDLITGFRPVRAADSPGGDRIMMTLSLTDVETVR